MLIAPLLLALAAAQPAVAAAPLVSRAPLAAVLPPGVLAAQADSDQGLGRGIRNMLVGAAVTGVGLLVLLGATGAFVGGFVGYGLLSMFLPAAALPIVTVGMFIGSLLAVGAVLITAIGLIWLGVNGMLVIARLDPEYKPSPATQYLDR